MINLSSKMIFNPFNFNLRKIFIMNTRAWIPLIAAIVTFHFTDLFIYQLHSFLWISPKGSDKVMCNVSARSSYNSRIQNLTAIIFSYKKMILNNKKDPITHHWSYTVHACNIPHGTLKKNKLVIHKFDYSSLINLTKAR